MRGLLDGRRKVAADGRAHDVAQRNLPKGDAALEDVGARGQKRVHKGKGRGDGALEKGLGEAAQLAVVHRVEPAVRALARGAMVPRRVLVVVLEPVPRAPHGLADGARAGVVLAVQPLPARLVLARRLGRRGAVSAREQPPVRHAVEPARLVKDGVPAAPLQRHELVHPAEGVLLGQLEDARRAHAVSAVSVARVEQPAAPALRLVPLELVVEQARVDGVVAADAQAPALALPLLLPRALARGLKGGDGARAQRIEARDGAAKARRHGAVLRLHGERRRQRRHCRLAELVKRAEVVGVRRPRVHAGALGLAQVTVVGARRLQVEALEPGVQDAAGPVHVAVRRAGLRRVRAEVAALVVARRRLRLRQPPAAAVGALPALLALAQEPARVHLVLRAPPGIVAARRGAALTPALLEHARGARNARERLAQLGAHALHVRADAVGGEAVLLGDVVQRAAAEALGVRRPGEVARMALRRVAAGVVGVQLGVDDVDAHLQPHAAHALGLRVAGLKEPARGEGGALARDAARVRDAEALLAAALLAVDARTAALAELAAHVLV